MRTGLSFQLEELLKLRLPVYLILGSTHLLTLEVALLVSALLVVRKLIVRWSQHRYCAYGDLKNAGKASPAPKKECAVIIGASISGILSGRSFHV
jgi:hypothetical protein